MAQAESSLRLRLQYEPIIETEYTILHTRITVEMEHASFSRCYRPEYTPAGLCPVLYIAPLRETYSEALSVQLRPKRNVLGSLQKEDIVLEQQAQRRREFIPSGGANHRESP